MNQANEGLSLGVRVFLAVLVASMILAAFAVVRGTIIKQSSNVSDITAGIHDSDFTKFNDKDVQGFELWDLLREQSGNRINGYSFTVHVKTGTMDATWSSDQSIGSVFSDNHSDSNYLGEDQTYHCALVRDNDNAGQVIGIEATLII